MTFDPRSKARKAAMGLRAAYAMTPAAADAIESALMLAVSEERARCPMCGADAGKIRMEE